MLAALSIATLLAIDVFVVIPEKLGDRPYNALGHDSRLAAHPEGRSPLH